VRGTKQAVKEHWEQAPCGDGLSPAERGTDRYFADIEAAKDRLEPYVHRFAAFDSWAGRDVLEIGCGVGTDTVRFARAGARVIAVDLTETAVNLTSDRLAAERLDGMALVADAEALPFRDASFDLVYSWGVLHHTPDTPRAVSEAARVLRPGGMARVMLYNRHSFFAVGVWLLRGLARGASLADAVATVESPGTKAYTRHEVERLFAPFARIEIATVATPYDRRVAGPLAGRLPHLGWNHLISATV
jgi:SAM-dependent methyltransferase